MFEWLERYIENRKRLNYLEFEIEQSKAELWRWTHGDLSNVKLTKDSIASKLEEYISNLEIEFECNQNKQRELTSFINRFDDVESRILIGKYIKGKTLEEIAYELGYSYGHIRRIHANVIRTIKYIDELI